MCGLESRAAATLLLGPEIINLSPGRRELTLGRRGSGRLMGTQHAIDSYSCKFTMESSSDVSGINFLVGWHVGRFELRQSYFAAFSWPVLITWNICIRRMVVRVGSLQLGPSWTLANDDIMSLAASFRLQGKQSPVGWRLAGPDFSKWLASFDLCVNLANRVEIK